MRRLLVDVSSPTMATKFKMAHQGLRPQLSLNVVSPSSIVSSSSDIGRLLLNWFTAVRQSKAKALEKRSKLWLPCILLTTHHCHLSSLECRLWEEAQEQVSGRCGSR